MEVRLPGSYLTIETDYRKMLREALGPEDFEAWDSKTASPEVVGKACALMDIHLYLMQDVAADAAFTIRDNERRRRMTMAITT